MDSMEALSSTMQSHVSQTLLDTDAKPSPQKVCMMRGEASAEIGDEMTTNNSMQWQMNLGIKQEQDNKDDDCVPKGGPGLYQWFENQALSEAVSSVNVDQVDPHSASIQEILEASRLSKTKDLLQLLDEIGAGDTSALAGHYWQEAGSSEFNPQSTDSYSLQFCATGGWYHLDRAECGRNRKRAVTVECIQAGEAAFPLGQSSTSSQELRDYNNDIRKQEEKKRKRRERNKQCSREFRRKQKVREQLLTRGKVEKEQLLVERHKRMEKTTKILIKIATSSGACEKGRSIINKVAGLINKENLPRAMVKGNMVSNRHVSHTRTQAF
ncbi:hypothetical protein OS493_012773 [Desmophyllum pertusum]|uniref:BZIP domain-containing protein n=1 Tax=Desmophyllum pertusum TaxID=174260 RepID=A0A9W9ZE26_9CNID|nr:hypothetical protein OS493_012773 [Desmophyllum pertusum]